MWLQQYSLEMTGSCWLTAIPTAGGTQMCGTHRVATSNPASLPFLPWCANYARS
jgi:hypothetical protein